VKTLYSRTVRYSAISLASNDNTEGTVSLLLGKWILGNTKYRRFEENQWGVKVLDALLLKVRNFFFLY
jgi:hypothetical protein